MSPVLPGAEPRADFAAESSVMEMIDAVRWTQPASGVFLESLLADTRTFFEVFPWNGEEEGLED